MIKGYLSKSGDNLTPDANWWLEQIEKGEKWRNKVTCHDRWKRWREYYRGDWKDGIMPVNLFFTMENITVPKIYFRDPAVSIVPGKPGLENMAFARILERTDNKLLRQMRVKKYLKKCVRDTFKFGTGIPKLGFGSAYAYDQADLTGPIATDKDGNSLEYFESSRDNMPWLARVRTDRFVMPEQTEILGEQRWVAEEQWRNIEDIENDPRLKNNKNINDGRYNTTSFADQKTIEAKDGMAKLYEVRDQKTGQVFVLFPESSSKTRVLYNGPDIMQTINRLPYFPIVFNEDDEFAWGIADSKNLEPYQLEVNENRTQIMWHRRLTIAKIIAKRGSITIEEAEKLVEEDVLPVIFTEEDPNRAVKVMQTGQIPRELFATMEQTMGDVREMVGFSRNQAGEFNSQTADTTATEAAIVERAANIRVDERRDVMADVLEDIVEHMHSVIFNLWTSEQVIDLVGPGGAPIWVQFTGKNLAKGKYSVDIDPDSNLPESRELREQRATRAYELLKANPIIDPYKLTQFLLHEMRGTQFDDLMRMLPTPTENPGTNPVNPQQFGTLVQQSLSQLPTG